MSNNDDVLDADLMRELGIDPDESVGPPVKRKPTPAKKIETSAENVSDVARATVSERKVAETPSAPASASPKVPQEPEPAVDARSISQDIPVNVALVMAKKTVKLSEIASLRTGDLIEFKKDPQEAVDLVANGKLIGKGELVVINGKVGVRIIKLLK